MLRDGRDEGFDPVIAAFIHDDPRGLADPYGLEETAPSPLAARGMRI